MKEAKILAKAAGIYAASAALNVTANAAGTVHRASTKGCGRLQGTIQRLQDKHDAIVTPR